MASPEHDALAERMLADHGGGRLVREDRPSPDALVAAIELMDASALDIDPGVSAAAGTVGGVDGVWFTPAGTEGSDQTIVYFHGGGYMFGTARNTGHVTARIAREARARAFSVDYRLSWQAPFPAALDDALAVYRGLLDDGVPASSIAVAGDSAGGGLAIALLVAARDAELPLPCAAYATSAYTDLAVTGASAHEVDDPIVTAVGLRMLGDGYLDGRDPTTPLASPLYADLTGLPPLLLHVGGFEALRDDSTRLADRARAAGVDVTLEVLDGVIHIWQYFGPDLPETARTDRDAGAFLRSHLDA